MPQGRDPWAFPSSTCTWVVRVSELLPTAVPSQRFSRLALLSHPQGPAGYCGQAQHLTAPRASAQHHQDWWGCERSPGLVSGLGDAGVHSFTTAFWFVFLEERKTTFLKGKQLKINPGSTVLIQITLEETAETKACIHSASSAI